MLVSWFVYATVNILSPAQGDRHTPRDAVVSLAPQTHRLAAAQQLVRDGIGDILVISYFDHDPLNYLAHDPLNLRSGEAAEAPPLQNYCETLQEYRTVCFTPEENATIGEAYAIAQLAQDQTWESLIIVTDPTHAFRTRFIFDQCLGDDLDITVVVSDRDLEPSDRLWRATYENAAMVKAMWETLWHC